MLGTRLILFISFLFIVGCNVLPGETKFPTGTPTPGYYGPNALAEVEQIHTLPKSDTIATSCEVYNLQNITKTTPCSCTAGVCTVGLKGNPGFTGQANFNYRYYSNGKRFNNTHGTFNIIPVVPFVSTWRVGDASYGDGDNTVTLPLRSGFNYNFTVEWGDGNTAQVTAHDDIDIDHTYGLPGDYTITIIGLVEAWYFDNTGDKDKIISISELGTVGWKSFGNAFHGCSKLTTITGGDTSNVTDMSGMFSFASAANPNTSNWDTSNVIDMSSMFRNADTANPDTSNWNTSNVSNMSHMFDDAIVANPDTSNWDTSNVTNMSYMFDSANAADTGNWDTSSVTDMSFMFYYVSWTPNTTNWDTSNVTNMRRTFAFSDANPDVSNWDVSKVEDMTRMFANTTSATPDTSSWTTTSLTNLDGMFSYASIANPDTRGWDVSKVTVMRDLFEYAVNANPDTSLWDTSMVLSMEGMFSGATSADPVMSSWDFSSIQILEDVFNGITLSTANYDDFLIRMDATGPTSPPLVFDGIHGGSSRYTGGGAAATARSNLVSNGWIILDGGVAP